MKRLWRERPDVFGRGIAAMHSPEVRRKAADARRRPLKDRFEEKVSPEPNSGCWLWLGAADRLGYGQLRVNGKSVLATHVSLELSGQRRPFRKACALHKCDNPACVNPDHLEWGTMKRNTHQMMERGRMNISGFAIGHEMMRARTASRPMKLCENCGVEYRAKRHQLCGNKHFFCSQECSLAWQKATYTGRPKASWSVA